MSHVAAASGSPASRRSRAYWARTITYWVTTVLIAWEMAMGGVWDLVRIPFVRNVMEHLGYPLYFLTIIGIWKIPCAVALLAPRFVRLKEWAYAGAVFNYTGAVASHIAVGDGPAKWVGPLIYAAITFASWALRPPSRRDLPRGA
jgi:uncharacterized membrane protein YphA (DoxX/SURF4 family)